MNREGEAIADAIGEQPRPILEADLDALMANNPLPYTYTNGTVSRLSPPSANQSSQADPRSHGTQVQQ
jgi:hypothetical protein